MKKVALFALCFLLSSQASYAGRVVHQVIKDGEIHLALLQHEMQSFNPSQEFTIGAAPSGWYVLSGLVGCGIVSALKGTIDTGYTGPVLGVAAVDLIRYGKTFFQGGEMIQHAENTCKALGYDRVSTSKWLRVRPEVEPVTLISLQTYLIDFRTTRIFVDGKRIGSYEELGHPSFISGFKLKALWCEGTEEALKKHWAKNPEEKLSDIVHMSKDPAGTFMVLMGRAHPKLIHSLNTVVRQFDSVRLLHDPELSFLA